MLILWLSPAALSSGTIGALPAWSDTALPGTAHEARWGDGDGDGDLDVVVSYNDYWGGDYGVVYFRNDGASTFVSANGVVYRPAPVAAMAFADLDGDGLPDLVVDGRCEDSATPDLMAWQNLGASLRKVWSRTTCRSPSDLVAADFDGDGDVDLVEATTGYADAIGVTPDPDVGLRNTGAALHVAGFGEDAFSFDADAGDWDADGQIEVVFARGGRERPEFADGAADAVYEVSAAGLVREWTSLEVESSASVAWGDLDGDGNLDLAVGGGLGADDKVYENTGTDLVLAHRIPKPVGVDVTWSVAWADYDLDGDLDLALGHLGGPRVMAFDGVGFLEVWSTVLNTSTWSPETEVQWGDADGDGDPDLLVAGLTQVHLFENL